MNNSTTLRTNLVNIAERDISPAEISFGDGKITKITPINDQVSGFALPGFIDAHVHIESSMLVPSAFAQLALTHGTVATVSDPHEIANVLGIAGVDFMIKNGKTVPFKFFFGAPSCVPATAFETAGATIDAAQISALLARDEILYLSEMMNYPGVLFEDAEVMQKIVAAHAAQKPIDGHAPGVRGQDAERYFAAGITTDHECFSYEEGLEKARLGIKILIREGSAAKNFEALIDLLPQFPDQVMFCSDDKHPDDLMVGHINQLVRRAVRRGINIFDVLKAACLNPIEHYKLPVGQLRVGDAADFIIVEDLENFRVSATYVDGVCVAENGSSDITLPEVQAINSFSVSPKSPDDFRVRAASMQIRVIKALDGELITESEILPTRIEEGFTVSDPIKDVLKFTVVNRYEDTAPAVAFIKGFGLQNAAIASSVGHDSHNLLAVGTSDELICKAVNALIETEGGIVAVSPTETRVLPLPVAGLMALEDGKTVGKQYQEIDRFAKSLGSKLNAPYMTLSFMALLVIPNLKLSDKGLFDGKTFTFAELFVD